MRSFSVPPLLILFATLGLGGLMLTGCDSNPIGAEKDQPTPKAYPDDETTPFAGAKNGPPTASLSTSPVLTFGVMKEVGTSRLARTDDAIGTKTNTTGLVPGHVTTLWWVIFNNPGECDGDCGAPDLFNSAVEASCPFADGSIVDDSGHIRFHDRLAVGETRNSCLEFFGAEDHGLLNPEGAEVHVVVRSHGPIIPGMVDEMRSTFAGGCEDFLDAGTVPEEQGECADLQFAVHTPLE